MKLLYITLAAVAFLAPLYALGCVGGYEAGQLPLLGLLAHCGAAWAAMWGSIMTCCKLSKTGGAAQ